MAIDAFTVRGMFSHLESGSGDKFFERVADNVDWTVEGTHPLAGRYLSKTEFHAPTFARLNKILPGGHAASCGERAHRWRLGRRGAALPCVATSGMRFDNRYCWVMRFKDEVIVEVRAYLDSALVQKLIYENEK